ncbi:MAG TPA: dynamin family protein, partial [Lamprocystis sp. (in: g-proteobacteria)]|nr:dynamin family protein [Lamprocystis sp. (in: g-proteobacteria)]
MQTPALQQRLSTYQQWKTRVGHAIHALETWLEDHRRATPAARAQLRAAQRALSRDRLTIAFVAECSHGKSELINAIFFADQGGRLLPSATGHSTLCPTELLWDDERNEAYLRLLPVETRVQDIPISQLKSDPKHWVHYPLSMQGPEQLALTLKEIRQTKTVAMAEATRLGLSSAGLGVDGQAAAPTVQIPKWRHAIVSLPHPLLKQGLVILDVPGATALGSEPELTSGLLPAVQAVVFVLATDVGVTRGDLEIWQHHLQGFQRGRQRPILVALNKVDALWMEQDTDAASDGLITAHRDSTAQALGIGQELVFPVSAQQALVAKLRNDDGLLRRSALPTLERHLATKVLESKYQSLVEAIDTGVGQILHRNRNR